jgi:osmotically-inducible protein OsmY
MIDNGFHDVLGQAKRLLADSPFHELRLLQVEIKNDSVLLRGRVPTFYMKQLAQETVRSATRGVQLVNDVDVA